LTEILSTLLVWPDLLIYLVLGAVAGLFAGLLGVGGGLIIVPVLLWLFSSKGMAPGVVMHLAVGTSLATIIVTSLSSIAAHQRRGAVQWRLVGLLTPGILLGAWSGAWLADLLSTLWLQRVFAAFAILVSMQMAFGFAVSAHRSLPGRSGMSVAGGLIGAVSAIVGIGGGSMTVPYLHWNGVAMRNAVATSAACGLPIALAGSVGFLVVGWGDGALPEGSGGFLYGPALPGIVITSLLFAPLGARLAHSIPVSALRRVFALLLFAVGIRLLLP
jgi:uncharacterized membrane protein YfcA